jgi:hypothetical protein
MLSTATTSFSSSASLVSIHFLKHFTYWIFVWFVVYVIAKKANHDTAVPNPFSWMVLAALSNLAIVVYTMHLLLSGAVPSTASNWHTLLLFVCVNACVKVLPILSLQFEVFFEKDNDEVSDDGGGGGGGGGGFLYGLALFGVYSAVCVCVLDEPYDRKWYRLKKSKGVLAKEGPLVQQMRRVFR